MIVPDLPPEESGEFLTLSKKYELSTVFLIAPTSSPERIRHIDDLSTDFTYCVSVTGVTGSRNGFGGDFEEFLTRVKQNTKKPFVVGFGINNKEQVRHISRFSDGVVIGSALLRAIGEKTNDGEIISAAKHFLSAVTSL